MLAATLATNNAVTEGISREWRERAMRDVVDGFLRDSLYIIGLHKGSAASCRGALYREKCVGSSPNTKDTTIEHVVTVGQVRTRFFSEKLDTTLNDKDFLRALLCPIALISKASEKRVSKTNSLAWPERPFDRYNGIDIEVLTFDQKVVDPANWSWQDHWNLIDTVDALEPLRGTYGRFS
jgi:hypothetical protein